MNDKNSEIKQKRFIAITIIFSFVLSLSLAEWVLSYQRQLIENSEHMDPGMILYDAELGWKLKPYWAGRHTHYDYDVSYSINSDGFRGKSAAAHLNSHNNDREKTFAIVGDSFSFGLGVNDEQTFTALLNASAENTAVFSSGSEYSFLNYSVPGYSTDQQLLLIKKQGDKITRNIVLVVYLGNDIFDNMRPFPLQAEHGKPYFSLQDNRLLLNNVPVPLTRKPAAARNTTISSLVMGKDYKQSFLSGFEISRRLALFQPDIQLNRERLAERFSDPLKLMSALIAEINSVLQARQGSLTVVLLPGRSYVQAPLSVSAGYQEYFRQSIKKSVTALPAVQVLDLALYLKQYYITQSKQLYYPNEGHLTPMGHQVVAEYLRSQL